MGCTKVAPDLSRSYNTLVYIRVQCVANIRIKVRVKVKFLFSKKHNTLLQSSNRHWSIMLVKVLQSKAS